MNYVLKVYEYYLSEYEFTDLGKLKGFTIDTEMMKLFNDFEEAEETRKKIFIETGLNFTVKKFKEERKEEN